jgi:hypothetical protein
MPSSSKRVGGRAAMLAWETKGMLTHHQPASTSFSIGQRERYDWKGQKSKGNVPTSPGAPPASRAGTYLEIHQTGEGSPTWTTDAMGNSSKRRE